MHVINIDAFAENFLKMDRPKGSTITIGCYTVTLQGEDAETVDDLLYTTAFRFRAYRDRGIPLSEEKAA